MKTISDNVENGKRIVRVRYTDDEIAAMEQRCNEYREDMEKKRMETISRKTKEA